MNALSDRMMHVTCAQYRKPSQLLTDKSSRIGKQIKHNICLFSARQDPRHHANAKLQSSYLKTPGTCPVSLSSRECSACNFGMLKSKARSHPAWFRQKPDNVDSHGFKAAAAVAAATAATATAAAAEAAAATAAAASTAAGQRGGGESGMEGR